jgi:hypothetical protein
VPSRTISAAAGTWRSLVSHFTTSIGAPRIAPAMSSSDTGSRVGDAAMKVRAGSWPMTTATGIGSLRSMYFR